MIVLFVQCGLGWKGGGKIVARIQLFYCKPHIRSKTLKDQKKNPNTSISSLEGAITQFLHPLLFPSPHQSPKISLILHKQVFHHDSK